jgi:hypothetical protein
MQISILWVGEDRTESNINHLKCVKDITVYSVITFLTDAIEDVQIIF